jgi:hypothetical protein
MVKADEIRDRESLKAWLEGRSREDSVIVAMRAAARAAPVAWAHPILREREGEVTGVSICRSLLIAGVAARGRSPAIVAAAQYAAAYTDDVLSGATEIRMSVAAAARAAWAVGDDPVNFAADAVAQAARLDSGWSEVSHDCGLLNAGEDLSERALWSVRYPVYFRDAWAQFGEHWRADPDYEFWLRWWEGKVSGNQVPWDLQEKVALIPTEVWRQGAEAVAGEIARVELEFAVEASPNAEDIIVNDDGQYEAIPRSTLPARTLQDARDRIRDTIQLIRGGEAQNQHAALLPEGTLLEDVLDRYGDNPLRLYEVCFKVVRHVGTHVANGALPEGDNLVGDVTGDLQNAADDIYNFDAEVRRTVDARAKLRFGRLDETEKKQVEDFALAVAERSTPELALEFREDAAAIRSEEVPTADTSDNRARLGSRLTRVVALGGQMFKDVTDALIWVGAVGAGTVVFATLLLLLLGLF